MQEYNRTMKYVESPQKPANDAGGLSVTIFDGRRPIVAPEAQTV